MGQVYDEVTGHKCHSHNHAHLRIACLSCNSKLCRKGNLDVRKVICCQCGNTSLVGQHEELKGIKNYNNIHEKRYLSAHRRKIYLKKRLEIK